MASGGEREPFRAARRYAALLERRAPLVVVGALLLTLLLGLSASRLRLRTDFTDLLPEETQSVRELRRINKRLGGVGTLNVSVETRRRPAAERFLRDLVRTTQARLDGELRYIDWTVRPVQAFYRRHGALFLSLDELRALDAALADAIRQAKLRANPLYVDLEDQGAATDRRVVRLVERLRQRGEAARRFPHGFYEGEGGQLLAIFLRPAGSALEIGAARELIARMWQIVGALHPERYDPSLRVSFTGTLQITVEEYDAIVRDIVGTAGLCVALVALLVWLYFRLARVLLLLGVTLVAGAVWAFGLAGLGVGYLNAQTAFLGSIIVGTGINYGIILLARFRELRRAGAPTTEALPCALALTARPTVAAALTTALAFGTLGLARMRSFAQFGVIGGVGVLACWALTYTLLPALLLLFERSRWLQLGSVRPQGSALGYPGWLARLPGRYPAAVVAIFGVLVAWSAAAVGRFLPDALEGNINNLRTRTRGATAAMDDRVGAILGETLTPAVVLADSPEQARLICQALERLRAAQRENPTIGWCRSVESFLPADQDAKLAVLTRLRARLDRTPRALLPADVARRLGELRGRLAGGRVTLADVPEELRRQFRDRSAAEDVVLVAPGERRSLWRTEDLLAFADALRTIHLADGEVVHSSGEAIIFADLVRTIAADAPRTTAVAAAGVLLLLVLVLRRAGPVLENAAALVAGVAIMLGIAAALRVKVNFFNFVAIPTTLGIGVDYPVNVQQRHLQDGPGQLEHTLRETGAAVLVASLSTIIGYGVLLIAHSLALVSFGRLAILGELTCLAAALLLLPAIIALREEQRAPLGARASEPSAR